MNQRFTNQKALRAAFWQAHPDLDRRRGRPFGDASRLMHCTDTRLAWIDWLDRMMKDGLIGVKLWQRASLAARRR